MPKKPFLEAGQIVGTHGVRGEVRVQSWCDSPEIFASLKTLYWDAAGTQPVRVKSRVHKNLALAKLEGVDTVQDASVLRGRILYLNRRDLDLGDRYFIQDLVGLSVVDADSGAVYGELTDVSNTGANDIYHMRTPDGREILIPVIPDIIRRVDIDGGRIAICPMKGLFDDAF
ncbi:MAG: 16S rRNA processing protein RimM [Clostridiales bacterium]|nr:16S rRNA processing protein RimM [Clostridiales bacterium]